MYSKKGKEICMFIVGNHIRERRIQMKLTQQQLAHNALLDVTYMGRIERGEKEIGSFMLWRILHILNADWTTINKEIETAVMKLEKLENNHPRPKTIS